MPSQKKVFLGIDNTAGINTRLKKGFRQIGVKADFYSFDEHIFRYPADKIIKYSANSILRKMQKFFLLTKLILKYDYFFFLSVNTLLPNYKDIRLFRKFGKKTMLFFTGCDVRMPEKVIDRKWNPCRDCPQDYKDFVGCIIDIKRKRTEIIENTFDYIICHIPDADYLTKKYILAFSPINLDDFPAEKYDNMKISGKIKILHAPTNQHYKGSKYIIEAVDRLKKKYDIEFRLIENISIDELYKEIASSHLIIDQMVGGGYGLFSMEAMAMYRPVACYIREDLWEKIGNDCPIYNVNTDNIYAELDRILSDPEKLIETGRRSREYIEKYHDAKKIAQKYLEIFEHGS